MLAQPGTGPLTSPMTLLHLYVHFSSPLCICEHVLSSCPEASLGLGFLQATEEAACLSTPSQYSPRSLSLYSAMTTHSSLDCCLSIEQSLCSYPGFLLVKIQLFL